MQFASLFEYHRSAVEAGQWYRLFTCHLTHFSLDHLLWDVIAFAILGAICARRMPGRLMACLALAAITIPVAVHLFQPKLQTYRGLSGLDSAMFGLLAVSLLRDHWHHRHQVAFAATFTLCCAFAAKLAIECATGSAIFVQSADAGFVPVPLVHLVGAAVGAIIPLIPSSRKAWPLDAPGFSFPVRNMRFR